MEQVAKILDGTDKEFLLYSGNDGDTFSILTLGGYGVISVASHLVGGQIKEMMEKVISGEVAQGAAIHRHLLPLFNALFIVSNPIPLKHALNHLGFDVGKPRLPLTPPDEKSAAAIEAVLKNYKIALATA